MYLFGQLDPPPLALLSYSTLLNNYRVTNKRARLDLFTEGCQASIYTMACNNWIDGCASATNIRPDSYIWLPSRVC